ncbi:MAG: GNAT family N-acetyltransferase [Mycoplasma sp.]
MLVRTYDIDLIDKFELEIFNDAKYSYDVIFGMLNSSYRFFLIQENDKNVGMLIDLKIGDDYELIKLGILKDNRGIGFAYKSILEWFKLCDSNTFFLEVNSKNTNAISLYKKCGFQEIGFRKDYYKPNEDAITMKALIDSNK